MECPDIKKEPISPPFRSPLLPPIEAEGCGGYHHRPYQPNTNDYSQGRESQVPTIPYDKRMASHRPPLPTYHREALHNLPGQKNAACHAPFYGLDGFPNTASPHFHHGPLAQPHAAYMRTPQPFEPRHAYSSPQTLYHQFIRDDGLDGFTNIAPLDPYLHIQGPLVQPHVAYTRTPQPIGPRYPHASPLTPYHQVTGDKRHYPLPEQAMHTPDFISYRDPDAPYHPTSAKANTAFGLQGLGMEADYHRLRNRMSPRGPLEISTPRVPSHPLSGGSLWDSSHGRVPTAKQTRNTRHRTPYDGAQDRARARDPHPHPEASYRNKLSTM